MNRVDALLDWAFGLPDKPAIRFEGGVHTFAGLADAVAGAAAVLAPRVSRGDVVALYCENTPGFVVAEYACFWLGATVCPLNRGLTDADVADTCARLGVTVIVADGPPEGPDTGGPGIGVVALDDLLAGSSSAPPPVAVMTPDDGCLLLQTSGSTGRSKGVLLTYRNVVANYDRTYRWLGVTGADTLLITLPLYNTFGLNQGINLMAVTGATMVLHRSFSPRATADALRCDGVTFFPAVPTMMTRLQAIADGPVTDRAIRVGVGAAPTARAVVADVWTLLPGARVFLGYGLSEATALVTVAHVGDQAAGAVADLDTCGRAVPGVELAIDDPDESGLGEILLRGDLVFDSYVGTDVDRPVDDGWLRTGDLGRVRDGSLAVADRVRDLIIRGGQNVYPGDVERVLHQHSDVLEAAVIGRPDADLGEVPVAYVVARPGASLTAAVVDGWCAGELAAFRRPAETVLTDELPRGATGKISKPVLRERDRERQASGAG